MRVSHLSPPSFHVNQIPPANPLTLRYGETETQNRGKCVQIESKVTLINTYDNNIISIDIEKIESRCPKLLTMIVFGGFFIISVTLIW